MGSPLFLLTCSPAMNRADRLKPGLRTGDGSWEAPSSLRTCSLAMETVHARKRVFGADGLLANQLADTDADPTECARPRAPRPARWPPDTPSPGSARVRQRSPAARPDAHPNTSSGSSGYCRSWRLRGGFSVVHFPRQNSIHFRSFSRNFTCAPPGLQPILKLRI